ncbi:MAG: hypothetical protein ACRCYE_00900 [Sarcina sp.]
MGNKKVIIGSAIGIICGLAIVTGGTYYVCKENNANNVKPVINNQVPQTLDQYLAYGKKIQTQNYNDMINGTYAGAYEGISIEIPLENAKTTLNNLEPLSTLYYSDASVLNGLILDLQTAQESGLENILSELKQYNTLRNPNINGFNLTVYNNAYNAVVKDIQTAASDGIKAISYQSQSNMSNYNNYQNQREALSNQAILDFEAFKQVYTDILQKAGGVKSNTNTQVQAVLNNYAKKAQSLANNQKAMGINVGETTTQISVQNSQKYLNDMKQIIIAELNALSTVMPQQKVNVINSKIVKILNQNQTNFESKAQQITNNENSRTNYVNTNMANTYENLIVNLNQYM